MRMRMRMLSVCGVSMLVALAGCGDPDSGDGAAESDSKNADTSADTGTSADAASKSDADPNNWNQGYTLNAKFTGGYPDGKKLHIERDLFDSAASKQAFSFGSTHYSLGEIGFAVTETLYPEVDGKKLQLQFQLNFGLVKGSSANPVHVDKAGEYPFSCKAPEVRVSFMTEDFRTTCGGLDGKFVITDWSNSTGGEFRGHFKGRVGRYYDKPDKPNPCEADKEKLLCKSPEIYVDVDGYFGFTLPEKDG